MLVFDAVGAAREGLKRLPRPLALVPTMGALHDGHLQLVRAARAQCSSVAASLFVNPMQFGPGEDFERYPREAQSDRAKLQAEGIDILFAPLPAAIYPLGFSTIVDVGELSTAYEGAVRPGHFRGVATVVTKLLHIVQPDVLVIGQKDAQQTAVLKKVVRDLDFPVHVEIVPTVREPDGLALSSRNRYLTGEQRTAAPTLHESLGIMLEELRLGNDAEAARERARVHLSPLGTWDYLDVVEADTFAPLEYLRPPAFVVGAARFGQTRLIDNLMVPAA